MKNIIGLNKREIARKMNFLNEIIREPVSPEKRRAVLKRAKNKCQYLQYPRCKIRERGDIKLEIHHINGKRDDNKLSNLVALCGTHHSVMHRKYKLEHKRSICGERLSSRMVKNSVRKREKKTNFLNIPQLRY